MHPESAHASSVCMDQALKTYDPSAHHCTTAQHTQQKPHKEQKGVGMFLA